MLVRGIRGATTADTNTRDAIIDCTRDLLEELVRENGIRIKDIASIFFTSTPDLNAAFPASAARALGWTDVALLDAQAPPIQGDLARCIRVLIHWNTDATRSIRHVYLRGTQVLRPDLAQLRTKEEER